MLALANLLLPGLGHIMAGKRTKGLFLFLMFSCVFWTGYFLGNSSNYASMDEFLRFRENHAVYFILQLPNGVLPWLLVKIHEFFGPLNLPWQTNVFLHDTGVVYAAVGGLMNLLLMYDIFDKSDRATRMNAAKRRLRGVSA